MPAPASMCLLCFVLGCSPAPQSGGNRWTGAPPQAPSPDDSGRAAVGTLLESVTWRIAWNRDGLQPSDTASWRIDRTDGASFELVSGWLVLESVTLEPCEDPAAEARGSPPHGWPDHPSADTDTWALPLHEPMDQELSQHSFDPDWVCEVGVGLFQATNATRNLPSEPDLLGTSLWLEGQVRASSTDPWTPVEWHSSLSAEQDTVLPMLTETEAVLTVSLSPGRLLDAVYLDDAPELAGRSALTNLARSLSVAARP